MVYTRGSKEDYDRYAKLTGDKRWSWDSIFPYFLKVSEYYHGFYPCIHSG
jgi:choline dehydrogenase